MLVLFQGVANYVETIIHGKISPISMEKEVSLDDMMNIVELRVGK